MLVTIQSSQDEEESGGAGRWPLGEDGLKTSKFQDANGGLELRDKMAPGRDGQEQNSSI